MCKFTGLNMYYLMWLDLFEQGCLLIRDHKQPLGAYNLSVLLKKGMAMRDYLRIHIVKVLISFSFVSIISVSY